MSSLTTLLLDLILLLSPPYSTVFPYDDDHLNERKGRGSQNLLTCLELPQQYELFSDSHMGDSIPEFVTQNVKRD